MKASCAGPILAAMLLSTCAEPAAIPSPPEGYPYAYAMTDCAPWDGVATSIFLSADTLGNAVPAGSEVVPPFVRVSIYEAAVELPGRRFEIDGARSAGAERCERSGDCRVATGGWIRVRADATRERLAGDFELEFGPDPVSGRDADTLRGGFRAEWRQRSVMCG